MMPFPGPPRDVANWTTWAARLADFLTLVMRGKLNCVTEVTLAAGATTTTLLDERITPSSYIGLMPTTANAVAVIGGLYVSARRNGSATLTHANNANTDKTFTVAILG